MAEGVTCCFQPGCAGPGSERARGRGGDAQEARKPVERDMDLERIIQDSLMCFIQTHIPAADVSGMDEVVFSYITSVLEELGSAELAEENFDMDTFVEMMEAYIPGFAEINRGSVCEMMFALSERLSEVRSKDKVCRKPVGIGSRAPAEEQNPSHEQGAGASDAGRLLVPPAAAAVQGAGGDVKDGVQLLLEVFPACTLSQAQKALAMALGSLEEAVQLLVEEKVEPGEGPGGPSVKETVSSRRAPKSEELKRFILQKYMMVDSEEDQKTHRPVPPKEAPKKLIRYIDNQVVSTKGERFMNVKKPESEEMKRTYISLKPARKYKFH